MPQIHNKLRATARAHSHTLSADCANCGGSRVHTATETVATSNTRCKLSPWTPTTTPSSSFEQAMAASVTKVRPPQKSAKWPPTIAVHGSLPDTNKRMATYNMQWIACSKTEPASCTTSSHGFFPACGQSAARCLKEPQAKQHFRLLPFSLVLHLPWPCQTRPWRQCASPQGVEVVK